MAVGSRQQRGVVGRYNKYDVDKAETETLVTGPDGVEVGIGATGRLFPYHVDKAEKGTLVTGSDGDGN